MLAIASVSTLPHGAVVAQDHLGTPVAGGGVITAAQTGEESVSTTGDNTQPSMDERTDESPLPSGDASPEESEADADVESQENQAPSPVSAFEVTEGKAEAGTPDAQLVYRHKITNTGDPARISIVAVSAAGWPVTIAFSDGTVLVDSDGDGLLDLGADPLATRQARVIDATVTIPADAAPNTQDTLTLTVRSSLDPNPTVPTAIIDTTSVLAPAEQTGSSAQTVDTTEEGSLTSGLASPPESAIASIDPTNLSKTASGRETFCFGHTLNQIGSANKVTITLMVQGPDGWKAGFYADDACTIPFSPVDKNGAPSVTFDQKNPKTYANGVFVPQPFYVKVIVPAGASTGTYAVTITATPDKTNGTTATATDTIVISEQIPLALSIESNPEVYFGTVAPTGAPSGVDGITSAADDLGADYVYRSVATIQVTAPDDQSWTIACSASENDGSATSIRIGDGRLQWQNASSAEDSWTAFSTDPDAAVPCASGQGTAEITFDYRLRVAWSDPPGDFSTTVTYQLSP
jgi:hypothetical protein